MLAGTRRGDNGDNGDNDEDMGDEELDIKQSGTIHWKGEMAKKKNKNSKKQQQQRDEKDNNNSKKRSHDEMEESFFSIFETEGDMDADLCDMIHQDLTEDPVSFYLTALADDDVDGDGDDDDENDDDEE